MEVSIELDCQGCVGHVFHAIGEFLIQDEGPSKIVAVSVFQYEDEEDDDVFEAKVSWDTHPTPSQVSLFRDVWDEQSGFTDAVIVHVATSRIVNHPVDRSHELN
jgi:hypothetical protein